MRNEECQIYPARPLICRTQGNLLAFNINDQSHVDTCPLNEPAKKHAQPSDVMNLDLLNQILAQMNLEAGHDEKRIKLKFLIKDNFVNNNKM